jgi:hypothetical protein
LPKEKANEIGNVILSAHSQSPTTPPLLSSLDIKTDQGGKLHSTTSLTSKDFGLNLAFLKAQQVWPVGREWPLPPMSEEKEAKVKQVTQVILIPITFQQSKVLLNWVEKDSNRFQKSTELAYLASIVGISAYSIMTGWMLI